MGWLARIRPPRYFRGDSLPLLGHIFSPNLIPRLPSSTDSYVAADRRSYSNSNPDPCRGTGMPTG